MGLCEILTIVFVILKLTGYIAWSWWLVLLPEIIAFVIYIGIVVYDKVAVFRSVRKKMKNFHKHFDF